MHRLLASIRLAAVALLTLGTAASVAAELLPDAWPQARSDAARTGRGATITLAETPTVAWRARLVGPLTGEPVAGDGRVVVTQATGDVVALALADGSELWRFRPASWDVPPRGVVSDLALDDAGRVHAGLPADPLVLAAHAATARLAPLFERHAILTNRYPLGPELEDELVPAFIAALPPNPVTGEPMRASETPILGDYRYDAPPGYRWSFGVWNGDDALVLGGIDCNESGASLDPAWPLSETTGGLRLTLEVASGSLVTLREDGVAARRVAPAVLADGVAWSRWAATAGSVVPLARGGVELDDARDVSVALGNAGASAAVARDEASGNLFAALHDAGRALFDAAASRMAEAIASYSIDNNDYPPTGDVLEQLVPTYMRCAPARADGDGAVAWSPTHSPGDFDYVSDGTTYELAFWDDDGSRTAVTRDGVTVEPAGPGGALVASLGPDGALRWRHRLGGRSERVAGVALAPSSPSSPSGTLVAVTRSGAVVALSADTGEELWRTAIGHDVLEPPAIDADGAVVVSTAGGELVKLTATGDVAWRRRVGPGAITGPTLDASGTVLVGDAVGTLHAVAASGEIAWSLPLGGARLASLTSAPILVPLAGAPPGSGLVVVGRLDGELIALRGGE